MERAKALKQVYDLALGTGRSWQNPQTGWIHYCYSLEDEGEHYTIPVYENFLFALTLMRSKVGDNIQEAKAILEKLMPFQSDTFPVYLHEYPLCKDRWLGIHLLAVYVLILGGFHHVLGDPLNNSLKKSIEKLIEFTIAQTRIQPPPYQLNIKLAGVLCRLGKYFGREEWILMGEQLFEQLVDVKDQRAWFSPSFLGDILIGLQLGYPDIGKSLWGKLWVSICENWSLRLGAYIGPSWKEYQEGLETQTTLYDLIMGVYSGAFAYRMFIDKPIQLQGCLISDTAEVFPNERLELWGGSWFVRHAEKYTIGVMSKTASASESWQKGYIPFKVLWGNLNRYRSLIMQGGNCRTIAYEIKERGVDLIIELGESEESDDKQKRREICFFTEGYESDRLLVSDVPATTFKLNEPVTLHDEDRHFQLIFQKLQGEGEFMGHIMRGNRPSQVGNKGKHRTTAFDSMIFLRSVRRSGVCRFLVSFSG